MQMCCSFYNIQNESMLKLNLYARNTADFSTSGLFFFLDNLNYKYSESINSLKYMYYILFNIISKWSYLVIYLRPLRMNFVLELKQHRNKAIRGVRGNCVSLPFQIIMLQEHEQHLWLRQLQTESHSNHLVSVTKIRTRI